jgi:hypothetical protein
MLGGGEGAWVSVRRNNARLRVTTDDTALGRNLAARAFSLLRGSEEPQPYSMAYCAYLRAEAHAASYHAWFTKVGQ